MKKCILEPPAGKIKPDCSATEASKNFKFTHVACIYSSYYVAHMKQIIQDTYNFGCYTITFVLFILQCKISAIDFWDTAKYPMEFFDLCILSTYHLCIVLAKRLIGELFVGLLTAVHQAIHYMSFC